jgi:hypothetical protein
VFQRLIALARLVLDDLEELRCAMTTTLLRRRTVKLAALCVIGLAALLWPGELRAQERQSREAIAEFQTAVDGYLSVRWRAVRALPPLRPTAKIQEIVEVIDLQVRAIRMAREDARQGDIFRPRVVPVIRAVITDTLREQGLTVAELLAEMRADAPSGRRPQVNDRFPWLRGTAMPVCLLAALPPLPYELQYRFVDRDLVLLDLDLGLIVDVLPDALPTAASLR